jgi:hypothetical protein
MLNDESMQMQLAMKPVPVIFGRKQTSSHQKIKELLSFAKMTYRIKPDNELLKSFCFL